VFRKISVLCLFVSIVFFSNMPVFAKHYRKYSSETYRARKLKRFLRKGKRSSTDIKHITKDSFRKFKAKYGKECKARWSGSGYIRKIYNIQHTRQVSGDREKGVRQFLKDNSELFGIGDMLPSIKLLRQSKTLGTSRFVYGLKHMGVPVFGKRLYVNLCSANRIRMLNNEIPDNIAFLDYEELLTMDDAVKIAERFLSAENVHWYNSEDVYFPEYSNVYSKVWMLSFITSKPAGIWKIAIDKESGAVRWARNFAKRAVNGTGLVFDPNPITFHGDTSLKDNNDADSELLSSARISVTLKLLNDPISGFYVLSGPYANIVKADNQAKESDPDAFLYSRSNDKFNEVMAYYHIHTFHDYISSLGFNNILESSPIDINANGGIEDNSYYFPESNSITFGNGGVDDAEDADIIIHEYGHAILDDRVNLFGRNTESNTIGEAFGDYLACSYSAEKGFNPTYFAEWDASPFGAYLRKLETTTLYPDDVDGQEHNDSPLLSSVLWELRTMTDKTTADKLIIGTVNYITASATLQDFATGLLAADQAFYNGVHSSTIINLFKARGIYGTLISEEFEGISSLPTTEWLIKQTSTTTWRLSGFTDKNASVKGNQTDLQDEWLLSPQFGFEEQPKLAFFWMRDNDAVSPEQSAVLSVRVSTDGGGTFGDPVFTVTENSAPSNKWNHETITLRSYANTKNVVIGFQYTGKGGETIRVDNIIVVNSFVPPTVSITTPSGKKSGQISLSFMLSKLENDTASVTVEYSTDNGGTFKTATLSEGGNKTTGLSTSTSGISHTVIWNSLSDTGLTAQSAIFRITPQYGGVTGTAVKTSVFLVDNSAPAPSSSYTGLLLLMISFPLLLVLRKKV